jgi:hypothetical protein
MPKRQTINLKIFKPNATLDKGLELRIIEDQKCICNKGRLVISKPLQRQATMWYHHYLQHPGHDRLEGTMNAAIYWTGMQTTVQSITRSCKSCQVNKRRTLKYGHLPSKIVISTPWEALCVDLIGPYTLNSLTAIRFWRERKTRPPTQLTHKHHHHGGAVCPSYGVGSMDPPNLRRVTSSKGVGQGRYRGV